MNVNNNLAVIIAFYLSKFDKEAFRNLGFRTESEAFDSIAEALDIKRNYIKFRRDEFDPFHPWRKGWVRKTEKRVVRVLEAFQDMEEPDLREIVVNILNDEGYRTSEEAEQLTRIFREEIKARKGTGNYILRGPTGKKAEEYFISDFERRGMPVTGTLNDMRDYGCGYDFEIKNGNRKYFIEVKGLSEISGGIVMTNKEWKTAKAKGDRYYLAIVSNLNDEPIIKFIQNPARVLAPTRHVSTVVQVSWSVADRELRLIGN